MGARHPPRPGDPPGLRGVKSPASYKGLQGFHNYWGKKPLEPLLFLIEHLCPPGLTFVGCFDLVYSARSVSQDNRAGAMPSDFVLVYRPPGAAAGSDKLAALPGWSGRFPGQRDA